LLNAILLSNVTNEELSTVKKEKQYKHLMSKEDNNTVLPSCSGTQTIIKSMSILEKETAMHPIE
jgi:hypothetical protein